MRQTEMYPGMIAWLIHTDGSPIHPVRVITTGVVTGYSGRADSSEVIQVKLDENGMYLDDVYEDNNFNREIYPDKIGQPKPTRKVKNRRLMSLREGNKLVEEQEKAKQEAQERQETMERARQEMTELLTQHGILHEDIQVHARYDFDAKAAEVKSVRISGESIERMIQVFRDFENGKKEKGNDDPV